jgi:hypothetical protein
MIRVPRRGVSNIKTRGAGIGPTSESTSRHSVYLKLAMLEIERERRAKEQVASMARAARLQQRMDQIEGEVKNLHELVGEGPEEAPPPEPPAAPALPARRTRLFRF